MYLPEPLHYNVSLIRWGNESGRLIDKSVIAASRYIRRTIHITPDGQTLYYNKKPGLVFQKVLLPDNAPKDFENPEILWKSIEQFETTGVQLKLANGKPQIARHFEFHVHPKFDRATQERLALRYVQEQFVNCGMCAEVVIHDKGDGNPHVHVLTPMRALDEKGQWMSKQKKVYKPDKDGNKVRNPNSGKPICTTVKTTDWDNQGNAEKWRAAWAQMCNNEFRRLEIDKRVTHLSYERRGLPLERIERLNRREMSCKKRGIRTDKDDRNRAKKLRNNRWLLQERICRFLSDNIHSCEQELKVLRNVVRNKRKYRQLAVEGKRVCEQGRLALQDAGWKERKHRVFEREVYSPYRQMLEYLQNGMWKTQDYEYDEYLHLRAQMLDLLQTGELPELEPPQHEREQERGQVQELEDDLSR